MNVSLYTTEDDPDSIIVPRLIAAGADMKRIAFIEGKQIGDKQVKPLSIEQDIDTLKAHVLERDAKVLILDPIVTRLDENRDSNKYDDVMKVLEVLGQLLQENNAACIGVTHFNKSAGAIENRIMGSRAWRAYIRSLICVHRAEDNEDERVVTHSKCNYGPSQQSLRFGFRNVKVGKDAKDDSDVFASQIVELGTSDVSDGEAVAAMDNRHLKAVENPKDRATAWLIKFFDGKTKHIPRKTIIEAAEQAGHKRATVCRASKDLDVEIKKDGRETLWAFSEL